MIHELSIELMRFVLHSDDRAIKFSMKTQLHRERNLALLTDQAATEYGEGLQLI